MKKVTTLVATLALGALLAQSALAANAVRISQVYGGGGGSTGTYLHDYVELFNNSGSAVNIGGWALEYGSAAGNWGSSAINIFNFPSGAMIQSCGYLLIELSTAGTAGAPLPVTPDYSTTSLSMSQSNGKVALFNATNANVVCGSEAAGTLVDKVAWGTGNCPEGVATAALTSTTTAVRNGGGMNDTDNNLADFTLSATPGVTMHNSASPKNANCLVTPANTSTWGQLKMLYR